VPDSNTAGDHLQLLREGIEALPLGADLMRKGPGGDQLEAWLKGMQGFPGARHPFHDRHRTSGRLTKMIFLI
jgi:hypothetical protein